MKESSLSILSHSSFREAISFQIGSTNAHSINVKASHLGKSDTWVSEINWIGRDVWVSQAFCNTRKLLSAAVQSDYFSALRTQMHFLQWRVVFQFQVVLSSQIMKGIEALCFLSLISAIILGRSCLGPVAIKGNWVTTTSRSLWLPDR